VLEAPGEIAHSARKLGLDAVTSTARRRRVMCLVEDQQAPRQQRPEPLPHRFGVSGVDQEIAGAQETAVGAPGVHAKSALSAHSCQVGSIEELEDEAKALLELGLPLVKDRGRRSNNNGLRLFAKE
jgi:hypothetical protein